MLKYIVIKKIILNIKTEIKIFFNLFIERILELKVEITTKAYDNVKNGLRSLSKYLSILTEL